MKEMLTKNLRIKPKGIGYFFIIIIEKCFGLLSIKLAGKKIDEFQDFVFINRK